MSLNFISKLKNEKPLTLATIAFYGLAGLILLLMLPLSNYPPHIGLLGIISLIAAYGLLKKRFWATWLVTTIFFVVTASIIYTLYYIIATDILATVAMISYLVFTWFFTAYTLFTRKAD
ncbi:MAG: hypothetical protein N3D85_06405 [Candidatus Bathyarchaeota archaeon]|nr:hypothetical protein [Candidatus Bathyarchaeota archaeon]